MIRDLKIEDLEVILKIYNYYVATSIVTLDHTPTSLKDFSAIVKLNQKSFPFLVYEENGKVLAYAYATAWKNKHGYKNAAESTIYVEPSAVGRGVGVKLYTELIKKLKFLEVNCIVGCLSLPNASSVALHEKLGFIKVGHFPEIGEKFNKKVSVGYWLLNT